MRRPWAWILALHVAFFLAWTGLEEWRHRGRPAFLLETEGADPRDLLAGDYLALAFPEARLQRAAREQDQPEGTHFAVRFAAAPAAGRHGGYEVRRALEKRPVPDGDYTAFPAEQGWARAEVSGGRLKFGVERWYFEESREGEVRALRPGSYWALVSLSPDGRLRLLRLVWD